LPYLSLVVGVLASNPEAYVVQRSMLTIALWVVHLWFTPFICHLMIAAGRPIFRTARPLLENAERIDELRVKDELQIFFFLGVSQHLGTASVLGRGIVFHAVRLVVFVFLLRYSIDLMSSAGCCLDEGDVR
jgi:hypothetical protein